MKISPIASYAYKASFRAQETAERAPEPPQYPCLEADPNSDRYIHGLYLPDGTVNGQKWGEHYGQQNL